MSDTFHVLLDSGAIYFALGAVICIMLGVGAPAASAMERRLSWSGG
jgi:hypothetical protein